MLLCGSKKIKVVLKLIVIIVNAFRADQVFTVFSATEFPTMQNFNIPSFHSTWV